MLKTVRLSIFCKSEEGTENRVHIGVLIAGCQDGVEHVRRVVKRDYIFSDRDKILNMDDLLPYGYLNPCATCDINRRNPQESTNPSSSSSFSRSNNNARDLFCNSCSPSEGSCYFVGRSQQSIKIRIVITPMRELY